mgnify:CR=1 FL=1
MLACEICSRTSDREREIENLREDREAILTIDAKESKEECCDALEVLGRIEAYWQATEEERGDILEAMEEEDFLL